MTDVKRVLVLGSTGMLGSMMAYHLRASGRLRVDAFARPELDADAVLAGAPLPALEPGDVAINCIGVIKPFCRDGDRAGVERAIRVNAAFPHLLARHVERAGGRLIQIATDCVYSGRGGAYAEPSPHDALDVYGKSKSLGEVFGGPFLNVRCSIVGLEAAQRLSLLEWFLGHADGAVVDGYAHHLWNGVTTLQFARLCELLVLDEELFGRALASAQTHHFVPNEALSKYDLLRLFGEVFERRIEVRRVADVGEPVDRTLATGLRVLASAFPPESQRAALRELREHAGAYRAAIGRAGRADRAGATRAGITAHG